VRSCGFRMMVHFVTLLAKCNSHFPDINSAWGGGGGASERTHKVMRDYANLWLTDIQLISWFVLSTPFSILRKWSIEHQLIDLFSSNILKFGHRSLNVCISCLDTKNKCSESVSKLSLLFSLCCMTLYNLLFLTHYFKFRYTTANPINLIHL
jgi:hypothetical protein